MGAGKSIRQRLQGLQADPDGSSGDRKCEDSRDAWAGGRIRVGDGMST